MARNVEKNYSQGSLPFIYIEVIVKLVRPNLRPDHLFKLKSGEEPGNLDVSLPNAQLFAIMIFDDHYRDIIQFLSTGYAPSGFTTIQKKQLVM